jgi:alpha-amylase/alpha-mannosidase (GH57 family)
MLTGENSMPWARLHGIHSYYDMVRLHESMPEVAATINFVPSLIAQLREYVEEGKSDAFLEHTKIPAEALNAQQKSFILRHFFMANYDQMIRSIPNYYKLLDRRGFDPGRVDYDEAIRFFSTQDYLDIQVFYNLVWFGFKAREEMPQLAELTMRGGRYTEDDKKAVLDMQQQILKSLIDAIKRAAVSRNIEISTTPFYHPILPLLIDTDFARRALKKSPLPSRMTASAHAAYQVAKGINYMQEFTGQRPHGMWPAEGSVCPEMIPMLAEAEISWIATDEGILFSSGVKGDRSETLYKPYTAEHNDARVNMVFRDRELSDLISFSYYRMKPEDAAGDLIRRIKGIGAACPADGNNIITIILDGENPWEHYAEGGKAFLTQVFQRLMEEKIQTTSIGKFIAENKPETTITKLHSGSWISANYAIWIGKSQKNQGWNYLKRTIDELGSLISPRTGDMSDANHRKAVDSFAAACGSDWFWWFDDDFDSAFKGDFDRIFRTHLKNTFTFLKRDIPIYLFNPIYRYEEVDSSIITPPAFIEPVIDGEASSFFEWINATRINVRRFGGTMAQTEELFETIYFGFNESSFFLRIDPIDDEKGFVLKDEEELIFYVHNEVNKHKLRLYREGGSYKLMAVEEPAEGFKGGEYPIKFAIGKVLEMSYPFTELGYKKSEHVTFVITIVRHGVEVRRYSHIHFEVPDENYELKMWTV